MQPPIPLFFLLIHSTFSTLAIDFSTKPSLESLECAREYGYQLAIILGSRSYGAVDANLRENVKNANASGLKTDLYIFPCAGKNPTVQANSMINALGNITNMVQRVWIDIEPSPAVSQACSWLSYSPDFNCDFVRRMARAIKNKGKKVGIYSSKNSWLEVFESEKTCMDFKDQLLWYPHYNNLLSFAGFQAFGGWETPYMKQYKGNAKVCNMIVDLNWRN